MSETLPEEQPEPGVVEVRYKGRLGNKMFQYCMGRIIADGLGFELRARPIDGFGRTAEEVGPRARWNSDELLPVEVHRGQGIDLDEVLTNRDPRYMRLHGHFQRYEYYRDHLEVIRSDWLSPDAPLPDVNPGALVVHVRGGDLWRRKTKTRRNRRKPPATGPLPVSHYRSIIEKLEWDELILVTQKLDDPIFARLVELYSPTVQSSDQLSDFNTLRGARRLVMSSSTFAWWAAALGQADEVHFPMYARWHPDTSLPGIDLVVDEPRYVLHDLGPMDDPVHGGADPEVLLDA